MFWQSTPFTVLLFILALLSTTIALVIWRRRPAPGASGLALLMLGAAWWTFAYALELASTSFAVKMWLVKSEYIGIELTTTLWLIFALQYTRREEWLTRRNLALLAIKPVLTVLLVFTNEAHGLIWSQVTLDTSGAFVTLSHDYGPFFLFHSIYDYILVSGAALILLVSARHGPHFYRIQIRLMILTVLVILCSNFLWISGIGGLQKFDPTPVAFLLASFVISLGIMRLGLFDLIPIARNAVVQQLADAMIVLDAKDRIVDMNSTAEGLFGVRLRSASGRALPEALPEFDRQLQPILQAETQGAEVALGRDAATRMYALQHRPILDHREQPIGRLLVLHDITQLRQAGDALRLSEQRYRALVEASIDGIFLETLEGKVLDCNNTACAMFGYPKAELIGMSVRDLVPPGATACIDIALADHAARGWSHLECEGQTRRGKTFPTEISSRLISLEGETRVIVHVRDISERRKAELEQQEHARFLTAMNDMTRVALTSSDIQAVLQALADRMGEIVSADATYIALWDATAQLPVPMAATGSLQHQYASMRVKPGEQTLTAAVLDLGKAIAIEDTQTTTLISQRITEQFPGRSLLGLPLIAGDHKLGAALIAHTTTHIFEPEEIERAMQAARQIALAIAKTKLLEETRRRGGQQEALNRIIVAAANAFSLAELLDVTLDRILEVVDLRKGAIWVANQCSSRGVDSALLMDIWPAGGSISTLAVYDWQAEDQPAHRNDLTPVMARHGIRASLITAIGTEAGTLGGFALFSTDPRPWLDDEVALLEGVGGQLGSAAQRLSLMERVRKQAEQLQQVIDAVPEGMVLLDEQQHILLANPAGDQFLTLFGNAHVGEVLTCLGEWPLASLLEKAHDRSSHELTIQDQGNRILIIDTHPVTLGPAQEGWMLMISDVTKERQALELAQRQQRLAAIGQLAAGIAHDFNNILQSIIGFADLIGHRSDLSSADHRRIELIAQQGRRGAALVRQILDFSRQSTPIRHHIDLVALLWETAEVLRSTLPASIRVEVVTPEQSCSASADPAQIQQVLVNLANNARDAMPQGGKLTLRLECYAEKCTQAPAPPRAGRWLVIAISDTGEGIAPEHLSHIFEPFFTTKIIGIGTGLGLAQAHGIIEQHDGAIQVSSQLGRGTSFFIYLPMMDPDTATIGRGSEGILDPGEPDTVLVIEAMADVADQLHNCLETAGYRAMPASSAQEALEILQEVAHTIDLVLLDVTYPGLNGIELAGQIPSRYPAIPVVLLGNDPLWEEIKHRHSKVIAATIPMPFTEDIVLHTLRKVLPDNKL